MKWWAYTWGGLYSGAYNRRFTVFMLFYIVSFVRTFFLERVPLCLFLGSEAWPFLSSAVFTVGTASGFRRSFHFPTKFNEDKNSGECERMYESLRKWFEHKPVCFDGTKFFLLQKSIQILRRDCSSLLPSLGNAKSVFSFQDYFCYYYCSHKQDKTL